MENKIRVILVDDEQSARNVLSGLLSRLFPEVEIVDMCTNVKEAVVSIKLHQPDAIFLDIEMPEYAGYEIVSFFDEVNFDIIFVTAYDSYAIKAFELSAVDYLLKPVDTTRLKAAIDKLSEKVRIKNQFESYKVLVESLQTPQVKKLVITHQGSRMAILVDDIVAIEAQESYCCIYTASNEQYLVSRNLKHYEGLLESCKKFIRTHKSWLIHLDHMVNYSKSKLEIKMKNNIEAKLSKNKIAEFETIVRS